MISTRTDITITFDTRTSELTLKNEAGKEVILDIIPEDYDNLEVFYSEIF